MDPTMEALAVVISARRSTGDSGIIPPSSPGKNFVGPLSTSPTTAMPIISIKEECPCTSPIPIHSISHGISLSRMLSGSSVGSLFNSASFPRRSYTGTASTFYQDLETARSSLPVACSTAGKPLSRRSEELKLPNSDWIFSMDEDPPF